MTVHRLSDGTTAYLSAGLSGLSELASADGDFDFASPEVDDVVLGRVYSACGWSIPPPYAPPGIIALRQSIREGRRLYLVAEDVGGESATLETGRSQVYVDLAPRSFLQASAWGIDARRLPESYRSRVRQCVIEDHARMLDVLRGALDDYEQMLCVLRVGLASRIVEWTLGLEATEAAVLTLKSKPGTFAKFLAQHGIKVVGGEPAKSGCDSREELERTVLQYIRVLRLIREGDSAVLLLRKRDGVETMHRIVGMSPQQIFQGIRGDEAAAFLISCNDPLRESWGSVIDELIASSTWVF